MRTHVLNINCNVACFCPKNLGYILIMQHFFGSLQYHLILSFGDAILLRVERYYLLPLNSFFLATFLELVGGILTEGSYPITEWGG